MSYITKLEPELSDLGRLVDLVMSCTPTPPATGQCVPHFLLIPPVRFDIVKHCLDNLLRRDENFDVVMFARWFRIMIESAQVREITYIPPFTSYVSAWEICL